MARNEDDRPLNKRLAELGLPVSSVTPEEERAFRNQAGYGTAYAWGVDAVMISVPPLAGAVFFGLSTRDFAALVWADAFVLWFSGLLYAAVNEFRIFRQPPGLLPKEERFAQLLARWGWVTQSRVKDTTRLLKGSSRGFFKILLNFLGFMFINTFVLVMLSVVIGAIFREDKHPIHLLVPSVVAGYFTTVEFWIFVTLSITGKIAYFGSIIARRTFSEQKGENLLTAFGLAGVDKEAGWYCFAHIWGVLLAGAIADKMGEGRLAMVLFVGIILVLRAFVAYFAISERLLFDYLWRQADREA